MIPDHIRQLIQDNLRPPTEGWTTPERGLEMAELILEQKPAICVEIGCFGGRSTIAQGFALRENGQGRLYTIDPWKQEAAVEAECEANRDWWTRNVNLHQIHEKAMELIWRHNLDEWIIVIRSASQHVSKMFPVIHHLLIDGNHSEPASCRDVELYVPRVVPGGWILFDDSDWPSTRKAIALLNGMAELVKDGGTHRLYQKR